MCPVNCRLLLYVVVFLLLATWQLTEQVNKQCLNYHHHHTIQISPSELHCVTLQYSFSIYVFVYFNTNLRTQKRTRKTEYFGTRLRKSDRRYQHLIVTMHNLLFCSDEMQLQIVLFGNTAYLEDTIASLMQSM